MSSKNEFNKTNNRPDKSKVPTHEELERKFLNHKNVTDNTKHQAQIDKYRNNYLDTKQKQEVRDGVQNHQFTQAVHTGFQSEKNRKGMEQNQQLGHERSRKEAWKEVKNYYKGNYSVAKNFNEKAPDKD